MSRCVRVCVCVCVCVCGFEGGGGIVCLYCFLVVAGGNVYACALCMWVLRLCVVL